MIISVKKYILFLFTLFYLISCKETTPSSDLLKQAEDIAFTHPADAVKLLESVDNPSGMDKENYMQYIVTMVQAKYNNKQNITSDTLIFEAQKYFNEKNNTERAANANFYTGIVYWAKDMPDKALKYFLFAERNSRQVKNKELEAKCLHSLGYIYYQQNMVDSAIVHYKKALQCYGDDKESAINRIKLNSGLGRSFDLKNNLDSALHYFTRAIEVANIIDNKKYQGIEAYNIGFILFRQKQYGKAKEYFNEAIQESSSTVDSLKIFLNYSLLYNQTQQLDSAKYYIDLINNRLPNIKDNQLLVSIYGSMSDYYLQTGDFTKALHFKDLQMSTDQKIAAARSTEKILDAENKYNLYLKEQEHKAERKFFVLLQFTVFILMALAFVFCRKRKYKRLKKLEEKVHSLTQDRLFENSIASKSYLENVYEHFIIGWSDIEAKVKQILSTGREEIDIEIYVEIKAMVDVLKKQTNEQLLNVAKDYLSSDLYLGKKLSTTLTDNELIILMLCHLQYSEEAIAFIIESKRNTFNLADIKWNIERKLNKAGMNGFNIKALLYPE
ncbi:tetratricopeptide repeat protein [Dysgonomonas sp. ZJ709]|uniref:tetratricopeptide repeat protein n=1 Tax=Dysgonomonas sp. ZJ709 TaxID=2709797 RepID=UPI0013EA1740|nr:tetratricopeptide repeat protein [Dysgonomonas sp. ZJ709]